MADGTTTTGIILVAKAGISKTTTTWATATTIQTVHQRAERAVLIVAVDQVVAAEVQAAAAVVQAAAVEVQAAVAVVEGAAVAEGDVEACSAFVFNLDIAGTLHSFVGREPECRGFSQIFVPLLDSSSKHFSFCV